jgi:hypothetical protein
MLTAKLEWFYQKGKLGQLQARDMVGMVLRYSQSDNQDRPMGFFRSASAPISLFNLNVRSHWLYFIYRN